jgi:hypothetical protein
MAERLRVTLRWIQILDKLEPFYKERGEFRFSARVTGDGRTQETRFPTEGHYEISDHPAWNKLNLDRVIFEGDRRADGGGAGLPDPERSARPVPAGVLG